MILKDATFAKETRKRRDSALSVWWLENHNTLFTDTFRKTESITRVV